MQSYPNGTLSDPDRTLTDPDMPLSDRTIASPVNAPCAASDSDLDFPEDISMHPAEDIRGTNQDRLSDDSLSDFFSMGEYFHEHYNQLHGPTKEELPRLRLRLLCTHIFNSLSFQVDSATTSSETITESQKDHGIEEEKIFGGSFTNENIKMMFVSGETAEPSPETTTLIEEITRQQVIEIVCTSNSTLKALVTNDQIAYPQHRLGNSPRSSLDLY